MAIGSFTTADAAVLPQAEAQAASFLSRWMQRAAQPYFFGSVFCIVT